MFRVVPPRDGATNSLARAQHLAGLPRGRPGRYDGRLLANGMESGDQSLALYLAALDGEGKALANASTTFAAVKLRDPAHLGRLSQQALRGLPPRRTLGTRPWPSHQHPRRRRGRGDEHGRRPAGAEGRQHGIPRQGAAARPRHYSAGVDAEGGAVAKYLSR